MGPHGAGLTRRSARSVYRPARDPLALDPGHVAVGEILRPDAAGGDYPQEGVGGVVIEVELGVAVREDDGQDGGGGGGRILFAILRDVRHDGGEVGAASTHELKVRGDGGYVADWVDGSGYGRNNLLRTGESYVYNRTVDGPGVYA